MRKLTKTALAVAAIAAVSLGSYWAYSVKVVGGMSQEDFLIIENVEALSQNSIVFQNEKMESLFKKVISNEKKRHKKKDAA